MKNKKVSVMMNGLKDTSVKESYVGIVKKIKGKAFFLDTNLNCSAAYHLDGLWIDSGIVLSVWIYKEI